MDVEQSDEIKKHEYNQQTDPNQLNQQPTGSRDQVSS